MSGGRCEHEEWYVTPSSTFGRGWCVQCKSEVGICTLLNGTRARMEAATRRAEALIKRLEAREP